MHGIHTRPHLTFDGFRRARKLANHRPSVGFDSTSHLIDEELATWVDLKAGDNKAGNLLDKPAWVFVESHNQLEHAFAHLLEQDVVSIDRKLSSDIGYWGKYSCFIGLSSCLTVYVMDALVLRQPLFDHLQSLMESKNVLKITHAADALLSTLQQEFQIKSLYLIDIQQVNWIINPSMETNTSLTQLTMQYLKVPNHEFPMSMEDVTKWEQRPPTYGMMKRARWDTNAILQIWLEMKKLILTNKDSIVLLLDQTKRQLRRCHFQIRPSLDDHLGAYGINVLNKDALQCAFDWRDTIARKYDVPHHRVWTDLEMIRFSEQEGSNHRYSVQLLCPESGEVVTETCPVLLAIGFLSQSKPGSTGLQSSQHIIENAIPQVFKGRGKKHLT